MLKIFAARIGFSDVIWKEKGHTNIYTNTKGAIDRLREITQAIFMMVF